MCTWISWFLLIFKAYFPKATCQNPSIRLRASCNARATSWNLKPFGKLSFGRPFLEPAIPGFLFEGFYFLCRASCIYHYGICLFTFQTYVRWATQGVVYYVYISSAWRVFIHSKWECNSWKEPLVVVYPARYLRRTRLKKFQHVVRKIWKEVLVI